MNLEDYYSDINLENLLNFREPKTLFDNEKYYRYIDISDLDVKVDTLDDFKYIARLCKNLDCLFILDTRPINKNPTYKQFSDCILAGYIYWFEKFKIKVKIVKMQN